MKHAVIKVIEECAAKARVAVVTIEKSSKHYKVKLQGKKPGIVFISVTPSDKLRVYKNVVTDMRRACNV